MSILYVNLYICFCLLILNFYFLILKTFDSYFFYLSLRNKMTVYTLTSGGCVSSSSRRLVAKCSSLGH